MKKIWVINCLAAFFLISCGKDTVKENPGPPVTPVTPVTPAGGSTTYFFANTDWTGVAGTPGQTYSQPCYLHFNGDSTVSVYVLFNLPKGSDLISTDSLIGKITAIDTVTNGQTTLSVNFPLTGDQQVYTITDKKTLTGNPASASVSTSQFTTSVQICPAIIPSINSTSWTTDKMTGGPTDGMYEFPDLSSITFGANGQTSYIRNGKLIAYTPPDQDKLLLFDYNQTGRRLYFAGYNESSDKLIIYYGVLSPDGNSIFADTKGRTDARLPYYFQTIFWYGPAGVTPVMHKEN